MSGWFMLQRDLERIPPAQVRIIATDQLNIKQPAVLKAALHLAIQIKCYCGSLVFHPKVYVFHGIKKSQNLAILGSANISASGLENGVEAGIRTSNPVVFKRLTRWFENFFATRPRGTSMSALLQIQRETMEAGGAKTFSSAV